MNRGDRREAIFADDQDRQRFLDTLAEACRKTAWQVHAYCLMKNHFHTKAYYTQLEKRLAAVTPEQRVSVLFHTAYLLSIGKFKH